MFTNVKTTKFATQFFLTGGTSVRGVICTNCDVQFGTGVRKTGKGVLPVVDMQTKLLINDHELTLTRKEFDFQNYFQNDAGVTARAWLKK
jgi:hypothetical protein